MIFEYKNEPKWWDPDAGPLITGVVKTGEIQHPLLRHNSVKKVCQGKDLELQCVITLSFIIC